MEDNIDKFNIALESFKHIYSTYLQNFWSALGSAVLFMGWILTSKDAREFVSSSILSQIILTMTLLILVIGHARIVFRFYRQSIEKLDILINFVESKYYNNYEITRPRLIVNLIIIMCLLISDIILVWAAK